MFLPRTLYLDAADMAAFIAAIPKSGWTWSPVGITWHNTAEPDLGQWDAWPQRVKEAWGDNYDHYCRFEQRWHSGPHFCATPDRSFVLCEPRADGVHASCFNRTHFGVETVGNFCRGGDDPLTGRGLASMQAAANIIAALCKRMSWTPSKAINFHRQCPADHHDCPGSRVTREWAVGLVESRLASLGAPSEPPPAPAGAPAFDLSAAPGVQGALNALGFRLDVDGVDGPETDQAIRSFQRHAGLAVDGRVGPATIAAIQTALREVK